MAMNKTCSNIPAQVFLDELMTAGRRGLDDSKMAADDLPDGMAMSVAMAAMRDGAAHVLQYGAQRRKVTRAQYGRIRVAEGVAAGR